MTPADLPVADRVASAAAASALRASTGAEAVRMTAAEADLATYGRLVVPGMGADDVHDAETLAAMLVDGSLLAWWAMAPDGVAGWCALAPRHGAYVAGAWHLYGAWVRPDSRGRGIARAMWAFRIGLVPEGVPVTVSVQPDKAASMAVARGLGFREVGTAPPWVNFVLEARDHAPGNVAARLPPVTGGAGRRP